MVESGHRKGVWQIAAISGHLKYSNLRKQIGFLAANFLAACVAILQQDKKPQRKRVAFATLFLKTCFSCFSCFSCFT
jgi:hypothetical protein